MSVPTQYGASRDEVQDSEGWRLLPARDRPCSFVLALCPCWKCSVVLCVLSVSVGAVACMPAPGLSSGGLAVPRSREPGHVGEHEGLCLPARCRDKHQFPSGSCHPGQPLLAGLSAPSRSRARVLSVRKQAALEGRRGSVSPILAPRQAATMGGDADTPSQQPTWHGHKDWTQRMQVLGVPGHSASTEFFLMTQTGHQRTKHGWLLLLRWPGTQTSGHLIKAWM